MTELSDAWLDGDPGARWRSGAVVGAGAGARAAGASLLEVEPGCRLPRHTDSAEEVVVVIAGTAEVLVDGRPPARLGPGGMALVPELTPHEVRNAGPGPLRFAAVYAAPEVVTTYGAPVQPAGERERVATA